MPFRWLVRLGYRTAAAYVVLFNAVALLDLVPGVRSYSYLVLRMWRNLVFLAERHVLHFSNLSSAAMTGSSDTEFLWIQCGCMIGVAVVSGLVWSVLDRERLREAWPRDLVRVGVRYALASALVSYGAAKLVAPGQFPVPAGPRLLEPVGRLSPMGLLWVFMGASAGYNAFSAAMEILGGALLYWRRTTPLGSVVSTGVLLNIVVLNFCYDVPVKLYSMNLLFMALFLLWPDMRRLAAVLVANRTAEPAPLEPPWKGRYLRSGAALIKFVVLGFFLYGIGGRFIGVAKAAPMSSAVAGIEGFWDVQEFCRDGAPVQAIVTDRSRWRRVLLYENFGSVRFVATGVDGNWINSGELDRATDASKLVVRTGPKGSEREFFVVTRPGSGRLTLAGSVGGHDVLVSLARADGSESQIFSRGFHWVSEHPYNR